jgi:hypothetical protein
VSAANNKFVEFPVAFLLIQEIQYIRNVTAALKKYARASPAVAITVHDTVTLA